MISECDDNGDAELDRQEFDIFMEHMAKDFNTKMETLAEFLVYKMLFNDGELDEIQEEPVNESDMKQINELVESLADPRMKTLFELFAKDGDTVSFKEVACGLYLLTNDIEESAKQATNLLLMLDKDDKRVLGYPEFTKLILAIAATTGQSFSHLANELTMAFLMYSDCEMENEVLKALTLADEHYVQVREKEKSINEQRKDDTGNTSVKMDALSYQRSLRLFDLWDINDDGGIDFDELFEGLLRYHNAAKDGKTEEEVRVAAHALMTADIDGNDMLDREEFACAMIAYADTNNVSTNELIDFMCVVSALQNIPAHTGG